MQKSYLEIEDRLFLPDATAAVLWDLDGTLVDSFTFDLGVCSRIMSKHVGRELTISEGLLREGFALSGDDFWRFLFMGAGLKADDRMIRKAFEDWLAMRLAEPFPLQEGIAELLPALKARGIPMAVVSNSPEAEVKAIVKNSGLLSWFDIVVGNDGKGRAKKPAPDSYLLAAEQVGFPIGKCAVIEDSALGLNASRSAGAYTIAVASGAESFAYLKASGLADVCYTVFQTCEFGIAAGGLPKIGTPDEGVNILIATILKSCGKPLQIRWNNDNWPLLGTQIDRCMRSSSHAMA
ncbi:MAG TPA: HAD family phosphatase [Hyphomicrobiales bacterium]|nr:HAD family phosphatase [Hyphomicrobiales bacterium]